MTYGLLVIIANGLYLLFSILVGVGIYLLLRKSRLVRWKGFISTTAFLVVLLAPFYDLIIQMGIKTYYQNFKMNDTIYAYPEKDENGKIENLGVGEVASFTISHFVEDKVRKNIVFEELSQKDLKLSNDFWGWYENHIQNYIEIGVFDDDKNRKLFRIDYQKNSIEAIKNQEARYQVTGNENQCTLNLCTKYTYIFKDIQTQKKLANAWFINFKSPKDNFRYKFLMWHGANGIPFSIEGLGNSKNIFEKQFGFRLNIGGVRKYNKDGKER